MDGVAVDAMDWGPGAVVEGTAEADDAKLALISAVLKQDGAGAAQAGESETSRLWRCGTLRNTEPGAAPMLRKAMEVSDERCVERCSALLLRCVLRLTTLSCLSACSCKRHETSQAAAAIVAAAEEEQREAEEEEEEEQVPVQSDEDNSGEESGAQGQGGTGSTARQKRARRSSNATERFDPETEQKRPQRATAAKKKQQAAGVGYRDDDVDELFAREVEKFTTSLAAELARR